MSNNSPIGIFDSGVGGLSILAKRTKFILQKMDALCQKESSDLYFTTANPRKFSKIASILLGYKIFAQKARI